MYLATKGYIVKEEDEATCLFTEAKDLPVLMYNPDDKVLGTPRNYMFLLATLLNNNTTEEKNKILEDMKNYANQYGEKPSGKDHPKWTEYLLKLLFQQSKQPIFSESKKRLPQKEV